MAPSSAAMPVSEGIPIIGRACGAIANQAERCGALEANFVRAAKPRLEIHRQRGASSVLPLNPSSAAAGRTRIA